MIVYYLYVFGRKLALSLPLQVSYFIASSIAVFQYLFLAKDRRNIKKNFKVIFPNENRLRISLRGMKLFANFNKHIVDFLRLSLIDEKFISRYIQVENTKYLDNALKQKRGAIILTAHLGSWEIGGAVITKLGYPIYAVALPHKNSKEDSFFNRQRGLCGLKTIPVGAAVRKCFSLLKSNNIIVLLGDRSFSDSGVKTVILNRPAIVPEGPARFSLKTKAPIIPGFIIRQKHSRFKMVFEKPVLPYSQDGKFKQEREIIDEYMTVFEKYIINFPEQWMIFNSFWNG